MAYGPVVEIEDAVGGQLFLQIPPAAGLAQRLTVLLVDAGVYVAFHAVFQLDLSVEQGLKQSIRTAADAQGPSVSGYQVKDAHQTVVHTQGLNQLHLPALGLNALLLFPQLLGGAVQEEALEILPPVFLHQLDIAHNV